MLVTQGDTFIAEECHTLAGLTPDIRYRKKQPIPKSITTFEAVQEYLARARPERIYTVSATPTRSPMCVLGISVDAWQNMDFFTSLETLLHRSKTWCKTYMDAKKDQATKDRLGLAVQKLVTQVE